MKLRELVDAYERTVIVRTLIQCYGRRTTAAMELGVAPSTLWNLIRKHKIGPEVPGGLKGRKNRPRGQRVERPIFGAPLDQGEVLRPFKKLPESAEQVWGPKGTAFRKNRAVPMEHQPLGHAALSECVADGLEEVLPGHLVVDSRNRWCMVWNDAIYVGPNKD